MGELFIHDILNYIARYNLDTFIETGTGKGTGLNYASKYPFKDLYSIEIIKELYDECVHKFAQDPRIHLINNDSINGLIEILEKLTTNNRVLFWLDAHFPGADFKFNNYFHRSDEPDIHMPLEKEIEIIYNTRKDCKDVYIIDDLRIYEDNDYELGSWDLKPKLGKPNIDFITNKYKKTHNISRDLRHQGFLILTPKN